MIIMTQEPGFNAMAKRIEGDIEIRVGKIIKAILTSKFDCLFLADIFSGIKVLKIPEECEIQGEIPVNWVDGHVSSPICETCAVIDQCRATSSLARESIN
jgi:hypothetical protein